MKKQLFALLGAAVTAFTSVPVTVSAAEDTADSPANNAAQEKAFSCQVRNSSGAGDVSFDGEDTEGGGFTCEWKDIKDCLFSKGYDLKAAEKAFTDYGNISCTYALASAVQGASQYGVHGWIENRSPVSADKYYGYIEYFIIEGYTDLKQLLKGDAEPLAQVTDNGRTYDLYCTTDTPDDECFGGLPVIQYWSVITPEDNPVKAGTETAESRRVNVDKHFKGWENECLEMRGTLAEVSFFAEGWETDSAAEGKVTVTRNEIEIGTTPTSSRRYTGLTPDGAYQYDVLNDFDTGDFTFEGAETDGGAFSCSWTDVYDCTFSKGKDLSAENKSYKDYGTISCAYSIEYSPKGISQYGLHGWVRSREKYGLEYAEFVIVDGYNEWRPFASGTSDAELLGQFTDNGCTYDIYRTCHTQISEMTDSTFYQYASVIRSEDNRGETDSTAYHSHRIDLDAHFRAWEEVGIDMSGALYDVAFWVVGAHSAESRSSGKANVTQNEIVFSPYSPADCTRSGKSPDAAYDCEMRNQQSIGAAEFDGTETAGGAFSCKWTDTVSTCFSKGHNLQQAKNQTYKDLGTVQCTYAADYTAKGTSWFGISGSIRNSKDTDLPVEYMIIDGYTGSRPIGSEPILDTVVIDGRTYNIYRVASSLSVNGSRSPVQYLSVISEDENTVMENEAGTIGGTISIDKHFAAWEAAGLEMSGQITKVKFSIEGWKSSGAVKVTENDITIGALSDNAPVGSIKGDVNADGRLSIADVVLFQKWLTADPDAALKNWKTADWDGDGILTAADLSLMKTAFLTAEPYSA